MPEFVCSGSCADRAKSLDLEKCMSALRRYPEGSMLWTAEHSSSEQSEMRPILELSSPYPDV